VVVCVSVVVGGSVVIVEGSVGLTRSVTPPLIGLLLNVRNYSQTVYFLTFTIRDQLNTCLLKVPVFP